MRTKVVVSLVCVACGYMSLFTACEPIEQMEQEETAQDVGPVCGQPAGDYFNVTLGTLEVSETFPTGADWDIDGSYADPFMEVFVWNTALEEVMFEYGTTEAGLNVTRVDLGADPLLGVYLEPEEVLVLCLPRGRVHEARHRGAQEREVELAREQAHQRDGREARAA